MGCVDLHGTLPLHLSFAAYSGTFGPVAKRAHDTVDWAWFKCAGVRFLSFSMALLASVTCVNDLLAFTGKDAWPTARRTLAPRSPRSPFTIYWTRLLITGLGLFFRTHARLTVIISDHRDMPNPAHLSTTTLGAALSPVRPMSPFAIHRLQQLLGVDFTDHAPQLCDDAQLVVEEVDRFVFFLVDELQLVRKNLIVLGDIRFMGLLGDV